MTGGVHAPCDPAAAAASRARRHQRAVGLRGHLCLYAPAAARFLRDRVRGAADCNSPVGLLARRGYRLGARLAIFVGFRRHPDRDRSFELLPRYGWQCILAGRFAAFLSVFCYALSVVIVRRMRLGETNISFSFYGFMTAIVIGGALSWLRGGPALTPDDVKIWLFPAPCPASRASALSRPITARRVALVAPFQYTQIIWGAVASYILWSQAAEPASDRGQRRGGRERPVRDLARIQAEGG